MEKHEIILRLKLVSILLEGEPSERRITEAWTEVLKVIKEMEKEDGSN